MMIDTTIYGRVGEGFALCQNCWMKADIPDEDMSPLYSHDDTSEEGMSCDTCEEYIFEPDPEWALRHDIEDILLWPKDEPYYKKSDRIIQVMHDHGLYPG
jgi:hypothetical protein